MNSLRSWMENTFGAAPSRWGTGFRSENQRGTSLISVFFSSSCSRWATGSTPTRVQAGCSTFPTERFSRRHWQITRGGSSSYGRRFPSWSHSRAIGRRPRKSSSRSPNGRAAGRFPIYFRKLNPIVYTTVKDSGVLLTMRYLVAPKDRRGIRQGMWEDTLREFANHSDIDLAYPTIRRYNNFLESNPAVRIETPVEEKAPKAEEH